ncbi:MAG: thiamine phosphate synthase [Candidatus Latescibacteria bacterium]|nr:thiamine phosphate synthase [Candidatus Latescibacterota bacterium]
MSKKKRLEDIDYYFITDSRLSKHGLLHDVHEAVRAGCSIIQYREKEKETGPLIQEAKAVKRLCSDNALFLVNDRIDVALAVDADGVHIGQDDMPFETARRLLGDSKIIGLTAHNVREAEEAERIGADYIGLSPIFETGTKKNAGTACGTSMITAVREKIRIPVVAIGGIDKSNIGDVILAGAYSACAISAVVCADDVYGETKTLRELILRNRQNRAM